MNRIVFFDVETSGLDPKYHEIIQIAAVAVDADNFDEIATFASKVKFDASLASEDALAVNSYDPGVWQREAVPTLQARGEFDNFLREHATVRMVSKRTGRPYKVAQLAGHNAATFDMPFLRAWFDRRPSEFLPAAFLVLDTLQLAMWAAQCPLAPIIPAGAEFRRSVPTNFKLGTLCEYLGVDLGDDAHDAVNDVRATVAIAREYLHEFAGREARHGSGQ